MHPVAFAQHFIQIVAVAQQNVTFYHDRAERQRTNDINRDNNDAIICTNGLSFSHFDTSFSHFDTSFSHFDTSFSLFDTSFSLFDTSFPLFDTSFPRFPTNRFYTCYTIPPISHFTSSSSHNVIKSHHFSTPVTHFVIWCFHESHHFPTPAHFSIKKPSPFPTDQSFSALLQDPPPHTTGFTTCNQLPDSLFLPPPLIDTQSAMNDF
jgi:hypothetical protein